MEGSARAPWTPVQLTVSERVTVMKERMLRGRASNESEEFLEAFNKLVRLRGQLRTVEKGVKMWLASSKSLSKSARFLAQAVETEREAFFQLSTDMDQELDNPSTLAAISKKIAMLDELISHRSTLAALRHLRNYHMRRSKAVDGRDIDEETKEGLRQAEEAAKLRYDEHYAELLESIRFVVGEADAHGHCRLISPELSAFKLSQFQFFLNAQKIIQGSEKEDAQDLNDEWNKFTVGLTETRERAKSNIQAARSTINSGATADAKAAQVSSDFVDEYQTGLQDDALEDDETNDDDYDEEDDRSSFSLDDSDLGLSPETQLTEHPDPPRVTL
ncbi:Hypothetical Protein FCC1311_078032 [Hondaea fermentalgiana]|uniref:Uncharacterized protein n=1 Tax=Hondaea fermentalgiana TaxID=2315210 RepID=A0A2R5GMQ7_9STRA|nr:Hypothetical Protein FCC1311_078032 [Hondaea fermentalgiana]|eukprot:GBG31579.1 Hypothetical Protein FCC1311_078032 [Hondaea fermentalgiana]